MFRNGKKQFCLILIPVFILLISGMCSSLAAAKTAGSGTDTQKTCSHTCYEIFVYSFCDSDGDGIGDLSGVAGKLDYICDLGFDMIWLTPVFPSPTYHKYDVTDYQQIDPQFGSLEDMDRLIEACHDRGVRIILDLPLNHTSTGHPWFLNAAEYLRDPKNDTESAAAECPYADYYCFSREQRDGYAPLAGTDWFYEARFWEGMPDLNLDSQAVRGEIRQILAFWQDRGVDGFRLDAVTSYYTQEKEQSIDFVRWLTAAAKERDPDCYLVGEAWTDADTYLQYYESGIDSMFDFAFAGQEGVIASVARGSKPASWYVQRLVEEENTIRAYETAVNAPFYTNHDMARSAGYYPDDGGARTKFALALNLLMPGNAFLYYGEELGMNGSGKDENKRAPMYWTGDPSGEGMCAGPPEMDTVAMKYPPLDQQLEDPASIWSCVREVISLRSQYPAVAGGMTQEVPELTGKELCALVRTMPGERSVLIVINASDQTQTADLSGLSEESPAAEVADRRDALTLTPYAIAVIGETDGDWTMINEGCVLPEKKTRRRRK